MADADASVLLAQLAHRFGIQGEFTDANGERQRVSAETQHALLRAFGVDASSDTAVRSALDRDERQTWVRALPSVVVIREGKDDPSLEITVSAQLSSCRWRLELEDGGHLEGETSIADLQLIDNREVDGIGLQRRRFGLPAGLPRGYHFFRIDCAPSRCRLIVCPSRCWLPERAEGEPRLWGVAAQLYLVRSSRNWGIGDFTDLRELMQGAADRGIDIVGVNPLHALFPDQPEQASPYSPSSRVLLNVLYLDVTAIEGFVDVPPDVQRSLSACRSAELVQYTRVAQMKLSVLRMLFSHTARDPSSGEWQEFEAFRAEQGDALRLGCLFQVLREHFARLDESRADWRQWPPEFQNPASTSVVAFADAHAEELSFGAWLQWQADRQLAAATAAGDGMRIGLYRDLAVGTDPAGAECWSNQSLTLAGVHVGAPPDLFQPTGQDWGLAPYNPRELKEEGYEPFVALLRANMRHAGALRLDHVMALQRLYWIPEGALPRDGAYVDYPLQDLLGIAALESQRHRCLVIGEDLGTVEPQFREQMRDAGILSYRVLNFERAADGHFLPADAYPALALAVAGNHDLPTLRGWWEGRDIQLKAHVAASEVPGTIQDEKARREIDRVRLLSVLGCKRAGTESVTVDDVVALVHSFLRETPCLLSMAQLDDLAGEADPVNVPGTWREYPNWRRRLGLDLGPLLARTEGAPSARLRELRPASPGVS